MKDLDYSDVLRDAQYLEDQLFIRDYHATLAKRLWELFSECVAGERYNSMDDFKDWLMSNTTLFEKE